MWYRLEVSLKGACSPFPHISFPAGWNSDVMARAAAAMLDHESAHEVHLLACTAARPGILATEDYGATIPALNSLFCPVLT